MNKEFRVWDEGMRHYYDGWSENTDILKDVWENIKEYGGTIMQFVGAFDKYQQKIFEGDIVLWENPDPYDGEEFVTRVVGYNCRTMGFRLYRFPEDIGAKAGSSFFPEEVEVIGNIFEGAIKGGVDYGLYLKIK